MKQLLGILITLLFMGVMTSQGAENYYVATNGNDSANGKSVGNAFATIQKGLDALSAGDTLKVRGGRYHEEVAISNRHDLTLQSYNNEQPIIDGTIPISGPWTTTNLNGHSVWVTSAPEDIWQLFVGDRMQVVARWPNVTVGHPCDPIQFKSNGYDPVEGSWWDIGTWGQMYNTWNGSGALTNHTLYHNLAAEGLSFAGGSIVLNFHSESQFSRNILTHEAGSNVLTYEPVVNPHDKGAGPFLIEALNALDLPGEWWYDQTTGLVWFWPLDGLDPNTMNIRGKTINYGLTMTGCSNISFTDIDFFACTVNAQNQSYLTFDDCLFDYPTWFPRVLGEHTYNVVKGESRMQPLGEGTTRLTDGSNYTIKNCIFRYSDAMVDMEDGFQNVVENNLFHHWSFSGMASFVLNMNSNFESVQSRNTFHTNGSKVMSKHANCDVDWSRAYWFGYFQNDGTAWQCKGGNGAGGGSDGVRRHHIWHHDAKKVGGRWDGSDGINGTDDHIVSWNVVASLLCKGDYHRVMNNVGIFSHDPTDNMLKIDMGSDTNDVKNAHTKTYNNLADSISAARSGYVPLNGDAQNNWNGYDHPDPSDNAADQLRDPKNLDFRPKATSELIDQGTIEPGINDDYLGTAPDIGAYEYGCTNYWIPGFQTLEASTPVPPNGSTTVKADADLMWLAGRDATSHNIYFGTNSGSLAFMTNQSNNIFEPGELEVGQTYYWRIDELTPTGTVAGAEWSFTPGTEITTAFASFYAIDDTYAAYDLNSASAATGINGSKTSIAFKSSNDGSEEKHGYIKFDVALTGEVVSATLMLHNPNGGTVNGLGIFAMTNTSWQEETLNWNNRPPIDGTLLDRKDIKTGWSSFYVSEGVTTGLVSFGMIKEIGSSSRAIDSSEAVSNQPVLIVEYAADLPALPTAPQNLTATGGPGRITLNWDESPEPHVIGYNVYSTDYYEDDFVRINPTLVTSSTYIDTDVVPGKLYYYKVRAVDQYDRLSCGTPWVTAVPQSGSGNTPPAFSSNPIVESAAVEDVAYSGTLADNASDNDGDAMTFSKQSGPTWLSIATNGELFGTPTNGDVGLNSWFVQVSDGVDASTATLQILVSNVNDAPAFTSDPVWEAGAPIDVLYSGSLVDDALDVDGDTLTFFKTGGPSWLSVATDGALSGTPLAANLGTNSWLVQVSDGIETNTATLQLMVTFGNTAPTFNSDPVVEAGGTAGAAYSASIADDASDDDGDPLTFSKTGGPSWLSVATDGVLSGTPTADNAGTNTFTVEVSDGNGGSDSADLQITVEVVSTLLAYEGFEYDAGNKIHGLNGGSGFSTAWVSSQGGIITDEYFTVVSPGDGWGDLLVSSNRLQRVSTGGMEALSRTLSADLDAGDLWFSVLWHPRSNEGFAIGSGALQKNGGPPDTITGGVGFGFMNTDNTMAYASIFHSSGRTDSASGLAISQDTPILLAGHIEFNAGIGGADLLTLYPVTTNLTLGTPVTVEADVDETTLNTLTMESNRGPGYDEIRVGRAFADVIPEETPYKQWENEYGLTGSGTNYTAHTDTDGMNQLVEYALGGNPGIADAAAILPRFGKIEGGGSASFQGLEYIYRRRTDAESRGLAYSLEESSNLISNEWTLVVNPEVGTAPLESGFEAVTNRISTDAKTNQFIRLRISID